MLADNANLVRDKPWSESTFCVKSKNRRASCHLFQPLHTQDVSHQVLPVTFHTRKTSKVATSLLPRAWEPHNPTGNPVPEDVNKKGTCIREAIELSDRRKRQRDRKSCEQTDWRIGLSRNPHIPLSSVQERVDNRLHPNGVAGRRSSRSPGKEGLANANLNPRSMADCATESISTTRSSTLSWFVAVASGDAENSAPIRRGGHYILLWCVLKGNIKEADRHKDSISRFDPLAAIQRIRRLLVPSTGGVSMALGVLYLDDKEMWY